MKTYVITVSRFFPSTHVRMGEETGFPDKIIHGEKIHTIRANYTLWKKRFDEIDKGNACLSIRYWSGKPYRSKQVEIKRLTNKDGIGIQGISFLNGDILNPFIGNTAKSLSEIAKNDGLSVSDFRGWFINYDLSKQLIIIHFTKNRY